MCVSFDLQHHRPIGVHQYVRKEIWAKGCMAAKYPFKKNKYNLAPTLLNEAEHADSSFEESAGCRLRAPGNAALVPVASLNVCSSPAFETYSRRRGLVLLCPTRSLVHQCRVVQAGGDVLGVMTATFLTAVAGIYSSSSNKQAFLEWWTSLWVSVSNVRAARPS
jgi:hypothetical protein